MNERTPLIIPIGIVAIIVFLLGFLGYLAYLQMPTDAALGSDGLVVDADAENSAESTGATAVDAAGQQSSAPELAATEELTTTTEVAHSGTLEASAPASADNAEAVTDAASTQPALVASDELVAAFTKGECISCHIIPGVEGTIEEIGPNLTNIGAVAATRRAGYTAEEYMTEALWSPNSHIVAECPGGPCEPGLMRRVNMAALTNAEATAISTYLLALGVESPEAELLMAESTLITSTNSVDSREDNTVAMTTTQDASAQNDVSTTTADVAPIDMAVVNAIVIKGTCGACHVIPGVDSAAGVLGPNLSNIGTDAATRIDGYTAQQYLHESILMPNAFIAPTCPTGPCMANIMLANLAELLTEDEINLMVNYLATLKSDG